MFLSCLQVHVSVAVCAEEYIVDAIQPLSDTVPWTTSRKFSAHGGVSPAVLRYATRFVYLDNDGSSVLQPILSNDVEV